MSKRTSNCPCRMGSVLLLWICRREATEVWSPLWQGHGIWRGSARVRTARVVCYTVCRQVLQRAQVPLLHLQQIQQDVPTLQRTSEVLPESRGRAGIKVHESGKYSSSQFVELPFFAMFGLNCYSSVVNGWVNWNARLKSAPNPKSLVSSFGAWHRW